MDNFKIDIISDNRETLLMAMKIAFMNNGGPTKGYVITDEYGLIFLRYPSSTKGMHEIPFPFSMDAEMATEFALHWLRECEYGQEPDHDGHNKKGWRLYVKDWSMVGQYWNSICAVKPQWTMYGK